MKKYHSLLRFLNSMCLVKASNKAPKILPPHYSIIRKGNSNKRYARADNLGGGLRK
ncbi:MAG: hypothetical protein ACRD8Z_06260 [Nitrososphaeraceae archaeon]